MGGARRGRNKYVAQGRSSRYVRDVSPSLGNSEVQFEKRELSALTKLFLVGVYSYGCMMVGNFLLEDNSKDLQRITSTLNEIQQVVEKKESFGLISTPAEKKMERYQRSQAKLMSSLEEKIDELLVEKLRTKKSKKTIRSQQIKIKGLQKRLRAILTLQKNEQIKKVSRTIAYTGLNWNNLLDEHEVKLKRFKFKQRDLEKTYLEINDITQLGGMEKFLDFKDNQKLAYLRMKRGFEAERSKLMRKKVLVRH